MNYTETINMRNAEIQIVFDYLFRVRRHTIKSIVGFINRNYFFSEKSNQVYLILKKPLTAEKAAFQPEKASMIYHHVMANNYHDYFAPVDEPLELF
jgi:hypothetical protein